jgi:hypothetical protein
MTLSITDTQHSYAQHFAERCYAKCHILFIAMLSVIMLNVIRLSLVLLNFVMLNIVMLNVIMLNVEVPFQEL